MIHFDYATVTQAVNELNRQGYVVDFNLPENISKFETGEYDTKDFEITGVYRYEGNSDPADEAIVYAIESSEGIKGLLVSGFGISANKNAKRVLDILEQKKGK